MIKKILFTIVCIVVIGFVINAHADISECTEAWIAWPGSTKARVCASQEVEKLEKEMNDLVKAIVAELRKCPDCFQNEKLFLTAQDAWKKYRDTNCTLEYDGPNVSSNVTSFYLCEARLTKARIVVLKGYLFCKKGDSDSCDPWPVSSSAKSCGTEGKKK